MWNCPKCGTPIESSFDVCWACGTSVDGDEDPNFVTADEADPIYDSRQTQEQHDTFDTFDLPEPPLDLVECYQASNSTEAKFLVDRLFEQGIPAAVQGGKFGSLYQLSTFSPRILVRSQDLIPARKLVESYEKRIRQRNSSDD